MTGGERTFVIASNVAEALLFHAKLEAPRECCGLLIGQANLATGFTPLNNESSKYGTFQLTSSMLAVQRRIRSKGLEVLAVYHSHPSAAAVLSVSDRRGIAASRLPWVVVSPHLGVGEISVHFPIDVPA